MNKKQYRRRRDIKSKLMAAICMLLVSSIMMVSTTYAWFTLSTAPEVTGINTSVGANGNLEMALLPKSGLVADIKSEAGDSVKPIEERNVTWGNLVDLGDNTIYGLDKITLFPSELNAATKDDNGNPKSLADTLLKTPTYGADGRISQLQANTSTGYFDKQTGTFSPNDFTGVRAVGTASGMTDRQLDYRNARSAGNTARAQAMTLASQSLNNNGSSLANIAIEYGMDGAAATFDRTHVASMRTIINDLQNNIFPQIERAYLQYILAYAASAATGTEDIVWQTISGAVEAENATLTSVLTALTNNNITLPGELTNAIGKYNTSMANIAAADTTVDGLEATLETNADATFTWEQIRPALSALADPSAMKINGFLASEVKEKLGDLVSSVTAQGGLTVMMETGGGVYADVADQCGNFTANVTIERVEYKDIVLNNMSARMETKSGVNPSYLNAIGIVVNNAGAPAGGAEGTMPITDMYGYIVDMAFRTNAAESNLLLQVEAKDRIYTDNTNEETMGHGASMTFKATTTDFTDDQVKGLMKAIRIVFFDPNDGFVKATAKLDADAATLGADGWTAKMYLYTVTVGGTTYEPYTATQGQNTVYYEENMTTVYGIKTNTGIYYLADQLNVAADGAVTLKNDAVVADAATFEAGIPMKENTTTAGENRKTDNVIMPLTQNTPTALSMLVYLDGNQVTNADVAATAATSMTGSVNLQFSSSASLVPMEYADLHIAGAAAAETTASSEAAGG